MDDTVVISGEKEETFDSLLSKITPENKHELIDWGKSVGNEIW